MTGVQRQPELAAREVFRSFLPRDSSCGATARRHLEAHLAQRLDATLEDAKSIASELVNNAYLHGEGRIELRVWAVQDRLRIEVIDQGHVDNLVPNHLDGPGGRGLIIVDRLSDRWGTREGRTHVWAEVTLPEPRRPV
jgi:anti-sigma regulatory factor (Ser/Thr protein kinase)